MAGAAPWESDPRADAVYRNTRAVWRSTAIGPFETHDEGDVFWFVSGVANPVCNGVVDARFPRERTGRRVREVVEAVAARGLPFVWHVTSTSPVLDEALADAGLLRVETPGMHRPLDAADDFGAPTPDGLDVMITGASEVDEVIGVFCEGFEFPPDQAAPFRFLFEQAEIDGLPVRQVLARLDGDPVAVGTVIGSGDVAGLYNIATVERARRRGIGAAVTRALLTAGRDLGCTSAVLQATEMGLPVYRALGFETVCQTSRYVWMPAETHEAS